ncbi:MAG: hypothetical protein P8N02_05335, partial [Actinomycetota bacterium]|nr:hypothetical protein [Actinomycetota bacterium]
EPASFWFTDWVDRIEQADDFAAVISAFIADYLVNLESEGELWAVIHAAHRPVLALDAFQAISTRIAARHHGQMSDRGVAPGEAGRMVLDLMSCCGDLYGGRPLDRATRKRIARMLHGAHWQDPEEVAAHTEVTLDLVDQELAGGRP